MGVVHPTKFKQNLRVFWEANESTSMRMGNSIPHNHEDHLAGKGENSLQHYNLVHKLIPMPQAMKIPAAKAAVDKEWEKFEKISAWNLTKVRSKKEVIDALWWYKTWPLSGYNLTLVKQKTSQETQKSLQIFLEPSANPKVIYTDNSLEFGKACE